jgi:hypothetical protein
MQQVAWDPLVGGGHQDRDLASVAPSMVAQQAFHPPLVLAQLGPMPLDQVHEHSARGILHARPLVLSDQPARATAKPSAPAIGERVAKRIVWPFP